MLAKIISGQRPELPLHASAFITTVRMRCQFFITKEVEGKTVRGQDALAYLIQNIEAKPNNELKMQDLEPLQMAF
eukprot:942721-Lingulodinium_polyedra.AAC.1